MTCDDGDLGRSSLLVPGLLNDISATVLHQSDLDYLAQAAAREDVS